MDFTAPAALKIIPGKKPSTDCSINSKAKPKASRRFFSFTVPFMLSPFHFAYRKKDSCAKILFSAFIKIIKLRFTCCLAGLGNNTLQIRLR